MSCHEGQFTALLKSRVHCTVISLVVNYNYCSNIRMSELIFGLPLISFESLVLESPNLIILNN